METEVSPSSPYVQQETCFEIRLYRRSHLVQGDLLLPEVAEMVVALLDEAEPERVLVEDTEYELIRRRYLLFPQRSGTLAIPAPVYSGWRAYARGEPTRLTVRPAAALTPGNPWLPTRDLSLSETWNPTTPDWEMGSPVERVVTVEARGLTAAQLPAVPAAPGPGLRVRSAGVERVDRFEDGGLVGTRRERLIYLGTAPGGLELPPLGLTWWDTDADAPVETLLPGREVRVAGPAGVAPSPAPSVPGLPDAAAPGPTADAGRLRVPLLRLVASVLIATVFLSVAITANAPARRRRRLRRAALGRFRRACRRGDPRGAWQSLQDWSVARPGSTPFAGPGALAARIRDPGAANALWALDAAIYRGGEWGGPATARIVTRALEHAPPRPAPATASRPLPPLNPPSPCPSPARGEGTC